MAEFGQISRQVGVEDKNSPPTPIVFLNSEDEIIYAEVYHPQMEIEYLRHDRLLRASWVPYVRFPIGEEEAAKAFALEVNEKTKK